MKQRKAKKVDGMRSHSSSSSSLLSRKIFKFRLHYRRISQKEEKWRKIAFVDIILEFCFFFIYKISSFIRHGTTLHEETFYLFGKPCRTVTFKEISAFS